MNLFLDFKLFFTFLRPEKKELTSRLLAFFMNL